MTSRRVWQGLLTLAVITAIGFVVAIALVRWIGGTFVSAREMASYDPVERFDLGRDPVDDIIRLRDPQPYVSSYDPHAPQRRGNARRLAPSEPARKHQREQNAMAASQLNGATGWNDGIDPRTPGAIDRAYAVRHAASAANAGSAATSDPQLRETRITADRIARESAGLSSDDAPNGEFRIAEGF